MGQIDQENISNDEVNLFNYWKVIFKRRYLLCGVFLVITIGTVVVNLLLPKIYRGEFIIKTATKDLAVVFNKINVDVNERAKSILPKTYQSVYNIKLTPLPDSVICKLHLLIDVKDTSDIPKIASELFEYINNFPFYKRLIEEEKERLQKELNELSNAIPYIEDALKNYNMSVKSERLTPEVLNPAELYNGMIDLKKRKVILEQSLKNHTGIEIIMQGIYPGHVEPKIKRNIVLSALIGVLSGILLIFVVEFVNKVRTPRENKQ